MGSIKRAKNIAMATSNARKRTSGNKNQATLRFKWVSHIRGNLNIPSNKPELCC